MVGRDAHAVRVRVGDQRLRPGRSVGQRYLVDDHARGSPLGQLGGIGGSRSVGHNRSDRHNNLPQLLIRLHVTMRLNDL